MLKRLNYIFGILLICVQVYAAEIQREGSVAAPNPALTPITIKKEIRLELTCGDLRARSITAGDEFIIEALLSRCDFTEGLPAKTEKDPIYPYHWAENLKTRQQTAAAPNPYSGLLIYYKGEPTGFLCMGVMPALGIGNGYNLQSHLPIVQTFEKMGAIQLKPNHQEIKEPKFAKDMYDKVYNCGMADFLPVIPRNFPEEHIQDALRMGVDAIKYLAKMAEPLPKGEGTIPGYIIGLFHPTDPLIIHLKAVGFVTDENPGFVEFYNKQRVMARFKLQASEVHKVSQ